MPRRLGPYAPLSATYASDDAIIAAGEKAELLYVRGLAFCAGIPENDGYITEAQLIRFVGAGMRDAKTRAKALVSAGLWEQAEGGYVVRAWLKWNKSADQLGRDRKKDRDRKAAKAAEREETVEESDDLSARNPGGIRAEEGTESGEGSERTPSGFQPRAHAREARASGASLHSTPQQDPLTPDASVEGESDACPKHLAQLGRPHGNCRACGTSPRVREEAIDDAEFEQFWAVFPRKVGKGNARKAWAKARDKGVDPQAIISAAARYRDDPIRRSRGDEYTAHPATWLNGERWDDQPSIRAVANGGGWLDN